MPQFSFLLRSLGVPGVLLAFCALAVISGFALGVTGYLAIRLAPMASRIVAPARGLVVRNLLLGTHVMVIATVVSFFHKAPEFVYRAF